MIRRHLELLRVALMGADALSAMALFLFLTQFYPEPARHILWVPVDTDASAKAALYGVAWAAALWFLGLYQLRLRWAVRTEFTDILRATALVWIATLTFLFLLHRDDGSRSFLLILFTTQPILTLGFRVGLRWLFGYYRSRGKNRSFMLIVGVNPAAEAFAERIERNRPLGIRVIGHVASLVDTPSAISRPVLGSVEDIDSIIHGTVVDEVAVCLPPEAADLAERITRLCAEEGMVVRIPRPQLEPIDSERHVEEFEGLLVESVVIARHRATSLMAKRALDILISAAALVVLSPLLVLVALVVWRADGRPILFRQTRVGRRGRPFTIYKFRTMATDAEDRYSEVAPMNEMTGAAFKMAEDPRVVHYGRFLRKTSLDELPQLWNVVRGEMSLVGPRPAPPREVAAYDIWHRRRLSMRPGITGLWQVSGRRGQETFDQRAQLDLAYIDQWSLLLDLSILARTVPAVVQGR